MSGLVDLSGAPMASAEQQRMQANYRKLANEPGQKGVFYRAALAMPHLGEIFAEEMKRQTDPVDFVQAISLFIGQQVADLALTLGKPPEKLAEMLIGGIAKSTASALFKVKNGEDREHVAVEINTKTGEIRDVDFRRQLNPETKP